MIVFVTRSFSVRKLSLEVQRTAASPPWQVNLELNIPRRLYCALLFGCIKALL
jgi:hypothetical protein